MITINSIEKTETNVTIEGSVMNNEFWRENLSSALNGIFATHGCHLNTNGELEGIGFALPPINEQVVNFTFSARL
ncbi:MAG: hypothetical protein ACK5QC_00715 [Bacteroidota bacterium]|jgi:hypothetical protein